MTRPTDFPEWVPDDNPAKILAPSSALIASGYTPGQPPASRTFNWILNTINKWLHFLDQTQQDIAATAVVAYGQSACLGLHLIDGGIWSWTASTSTLAWSGTMIFAYAGVPDSYNQVAAGSVTLSDGQVAYVEANAPIFLAADIANASSNLLNVAYPISLTVGMLVSGANIPANTTIISISGTTIGMSSNATGSAIGQKLAFCTINSFGVATAMNSALMAGPNTVVLARRSGSVVYVGAPGAEMAIRNQETKLWLGSSGYAATFIAIAGEALTAGQPVYISPGSDAGRTAGCVYKTDGTVYNSGVRAAFAGIVTLGGAASASVEILANGIYYGALPGGLVLSPGYMVYLSTITPGGLMPTNGPHNFVNPLGAPGQFITSVGIAVQQVSSGPVGLLVSTSAMAAQRNPAAIPPRVVVGPFSVVATAIASGSMHLGFYSCNSANVNRPIQAPFTAPYPGYITGLSITGSDMSAGSVTLDAIINSTVAGPSCILSNATPNLSAYALDVGHNYPFAAGDNLYIRITASSDYVVSGILSVAAFLTLEFSS